MVAKIQFRRDNSGNWTSSNTILAAGEFGYETDTGKAKIGDGTTTWVNLVYTIYTPSFSDILNKPTTIAGYGITDAFDAAFSSLTSKPTTIAGYGITDAFNGTFAALTGKPTTIAGYGITDAVSTSYVTFSNLAGKPTTIAGYGITDAFDGAFSSLTGKPTTVAGYGITDALTSVSFTQLTGKPITIAGYGIQDAFDGAFSSLGGRPTTLSGYGITDAFDGAFSSLTGKPTTLSGYGITDNVASLNSPTFTGTPTASTAATGTNTTQLATTQFVQAAITPFASITAASQIYFQDGAPTIQALGEVWLDTNAGAFYKSIAGSATVPLDSSLVSSSSSNVTIPAAGASDTRLVLATGTPSGTITFVVPVFLESFTSSGVNDPTLGTLTYHDSTTQGVASNNISRSTGNALDKKVKSFTYSSNGPTNTSTSFMTITISGKPEWQIQESHVQAKVDAIIDSAPGALDTLNELAAALGDDANFSTTITNSIATKAPLASPVLTGTPSAPTASVNTNTTQLATTAFVQQEIGTPFVKTDLSVTNFGTAAGSGALAYSNSSGVFTFVPPDLSSFLTTVAFSDLTTTPTTIAGYGITDAFDGVFASLGSKPTTIAGYGITDAFDGLFASLSSKPTTISGYGITDAFDSAFSSLSGKPTTISGYGITDALALGTSATTALAGNTTFSFASITSKPTTIAGYGITDAFDGAYGSLSSIPSTIAHTNANIDIGTNNFITTGKVYFANMFSALSDLPNATTYHGMFAHVHATGAAYFAHGGNWIRLANHSDLFSGAFSALTSKPTTLSGYGITDGVTSSAYNTALGLKANVLSPTLTGTPAAPTAASGTNTTQIATTAFVSAAVSSASGTYTNTSVDAHLNTGTASTGEVLSWTGSDYDWVAQSGGGGGASVSTSDSAPSSPSAGDLWFNTSVGGLFVYYTDADSSQWVEIVGKTGATGPSGAAATWTEKTSSYTAVAGNNLIVDTSNAVTVTLPSSATLGDEVRIIDGTGNAGTNSITVARNGHKIQGAAADLTVSTARAAFGLVYYNTAQGWLLTER